LTALLTPPDSATLEYDSVTIISLVEEDGELKVLGLKDFADSEKRVKVYEATHPGGQSA
jgi:hypothetical protein